jgi:hypothetical protein
MEKNKMFKNENDLKKIVDRLNIDTEPNPIHRENLRRQMLSAFNETHVGFWQKFGRTIMKSPIAKLAAAAAIIIAVVLSLTVLDKSIPSAYALEQTIKACEGLRFVHIKEFKEGESEPQEFWVKYDNKEVKQFRVYAPKWAEPREGPLTAVWKNGKAEILGKDENGKQVIVTRSREKLGEEMLQIVREADPRNKVQELYQLQTEGKLKLETSKPASDSEPIIITATLPPDSKDGGQMILYVDQNTKLVTRLIFNKAKERNGNQYSWEFLDYNAAVDEKFFTFEDIPESVPRYDRTWQKYDENARYNLSEIGLVQRQLEDNEIAVELARQFIQALIDKNYEKAAKLLGGTPAHNTAIVHQFTEFQTFKKLLLIEEPAEDANSFALAITVPCDVVVSRGSIVPVMRINIRVEPYPVDPNRWIVLDCYDKQLMVITDPTNTTSTFMKNINADLALLDINKCTAADVITVLGEPWAYKFQGKDLEKDNLPETYTMDYPGGFMVNIYKNQVMLWGSRQIPRCEIPGYIFSNSIQIGMSLDDVFKELGPPAKIVEDFDNGRHGGKEIMFEDNAIYANMNINERNGFCFYRYDSNGEKIRTYFDDNVLYRNMNKTEGLCFYGTISKGKRIRILFVDNKVFLIYEYRTEPAKPIE